ncbi:hypothetical protein [Chelatococcus reniformis]|uniref:DUF3551 domain-containing protein n=1 Tax=Chelatococcus reniformis TaxID=1494448 RepID=A0A916UUQ9_9HYPH|nr:hypothetical protein [Chelatococcus reniformis]GGC88597.1 hypothetical protein GCM10010994_53130 [Chelatococcus reniformis]
MKLLMVVVAVAVASPMGVAWAQSSKQAACREEAQRSVIPMRKGVCQMNPDTCRAHAKKVFDACMAR